MDSFYVVFIFLAAVAGGIAFSWLYIVPRISRKNMPDKEAESDVPKGKPIFCLIRDNFDGQTSYTTELSAEVADKIKAKHGNLGGQWTYRGKKVYEFCRISENEYVPYDTYLTKDRSNPPSNLHRYINQPEIAISRNVQSKQSLMEKYGGLLPWSIAIAFIIFMIQSS